MGKSLQNINQMLFSIQVILCSWKLSSSWLRHKAYLTYWWFIHRIVLHSAQYRGDVQKLFSQWVINKSLSSLPASLYPTSTLCPDLVHVVLLITIFYWVFHKPQRAVLYTCHFTHATNEIGSATPKMRKPGLREAN